MARAKTVDALTAFVAKKAQIDELLQKISAASADHFGVGPNQINWGHTGSIEYVLGRLRDAAAHLNIK